MSGTTLCPHCNTRFKIDEAQLESHRGMVRCGHCLQAFDARPGYIPCLPNPQLELPIQYEAVTHGDNFPIYMPAEETIDKHEAAEEIGLIEASVVNTAENSPMELAHDGLLDFTHIVKAEMLHTADESIAQSGSYDKEIITDEDDNNSLKSIDTDTSCNADNSPALNACDDTAEPENETINPLTGEEHSTSQPEDSFQVSDYGLTENDLMASLSPSDQPSGGIQTAEENVLAADEPPHHYMTLAEQVAIVHDVEDEQPPPPARIWPWAIATFLLVLVLFAQAAYFFRIDIAARLPQTRPALTNVCQLLGCSIPLPQRADLLNIESSNIEADPLHENQIALIAQLRNHATYAQAFPILELTLNDTRDKPLARRIFKPKDYLPQSENESVGILPNQELSLKLHLDTADLKPSGYRLALYYVQQ